MQVLDSVTIADIHHLAPLQHRKAKLTDIDAISELINFWAARNLMLTRSEALLAESIRDFHVILASPFKGKSGGLVGVCGLHILAADLAEVRGLAIHPSMQGRGLGKQLIKTCESEARSLALPALFAWTYQQEFFEKCNFIKIDKTNLHPKVWSECQRCVFFGNCNEIAMLKQLL